MRILTVDAETFWDADYTLSKMTTEAYVRDPRFKAHMLGIKNGDKQTVVVPTHRIQPALDMVPWKETAILCQHTHFDGLILSHHFGVVPAFYMDTLSMFRALYPAESASLENQCKVLGLKNQKGGASGYNVVNTRGIHTLSGYEYQRCAEYCADDCNLTWEIFNLLKAHFPLSELRLIDLIIRLFTDPVLRLNPELLQEAWHDERMATLALFQRALPQFAKEAEDAIERDDTAAWKKLKTPLSSNPQFARMLYNLGIDPPKKISPAAIKSGKVTTETAGFPPEGLIPEMTKEEKLAAKTRPEGAELHPSEIWAYAFSKSDEGFKHLLGSEDPLVPLLVEARLGVKSTIKETRAQRFMSIASRGTFPIYLLYYGGHTGRLSGGDKINAQNLNKFCPAPWCDGGKVDAEKLAELQYNNHYRGDLPECDDPECPKCHGTGVSPLRRAIEAPPGHVIVVRDLSGIEARVNAWLCGQDDMVDTFRRGENVYCEMASTIVGWSVTKKDKLLYFLGKAVVLGCGYGLGYKKFQSMLRVGMLGMPSILLGWDIADALGVNVEGFKHKNAGYINESLPPGVDFDTHALHCACADKIIRAFRDNKPKIPEFWQSCQNALGSILRGEVVELGTNGVVRTCREGFVLPNGMKIRYTELEAKAQGKRVEYSILKNRRKGERAKVYGGLCTENLVQALARIILTDAFTEMHRQGIRVVHQVHDEILAVCPESDSERVYEQMGRIMSTPPKWAPDLPLASEGGWDRVYIK